MRATAPDFRRSCENGPSAPARDGAEGGHGDRHMKTLVLLRHGQSQWNQENRFTGWVDVPLSPLGVEEARRAGQLLRDEKLTFDVAHTSLLRRAIKTLWIALEELDLMWIPVHKSWRVNERHYGPL